MIDFLPDKNQSDFKKLLVSYKVFRKTSNESAISTS